MKIKISMLVLFLVFLAIFYSSVEKAMDLPCDNQQRIAITGSIGSGMMAILCILIFPHANKKKVPAPS